MNIYFVMKTPGLEPGLSPQKGETQPIEFCLLVLKEINFIRHPLGEAVVN
jgi:hypothetical protein